MSSLLRPGLGERYGVAINSSSLEENGALECIGAAGFARLELELSARDERERLEARLAPLLWRAKYGLDGVATVGSIEAFAAWLELYPWIAEVELVRPGMARAFSSRALHEWLTSRCSWCGGTGWQEITRAGKRVRASRGVRNAKFAICSSCKGTGRMRMNLHERMRALSREAWKVDRAEYERIWSRLFARSAHELQRIATATRGPLQSALAPDTVPTE